MLQELVHVLGLFYEKARTGTDIDAVGSPEMSKVNTEEDFTQTGPFVSKILDQGNIYRVHLAMQPFLSDHQKLFQGRIETGRICHCHGDLRLDHIYLVDGFQNGRTKSRFRMFDCSIWRLSAKPARS
jgi:aminoglycoside phosphotransferase family enzyme